MSSTVRLLTAMREAGGAQHHLTAQWLELAQRNDALRAAFRQVFGNRLPTPQKFGSWLLERTGKKVGELTLLAQESKRLKAHRYAVRTSADFAEAARRVAETTVVAVQAPAVPPPKPAEVLETTRVVDSGRIVREPVRGRDGEPVLKTPAAPVRDYVLPAVAPATAPAEPIGSTPAANTPAWVRERRQPTKAELAAQHANTCGATAGGFADPFGVVSAAIAREHVSGSSMRVAGYWPRSGTF